MVCRSQFLRVLVDYHSFISNIGKERLLIMSNFYLLYLNVLEKSLHYYPKKQ